MKLMKFNKIKVKFRFKYTRDIKLIYLNKHVEYLFKKNQKRYQIKIVKYVKKLKSNANKIDKFY